MSKLLVTLCVALAVLAIANAKSLRKVPVCRDGNLHYLPDEDDCRNFYVCFGRKATLKTCPNDLYWDPSVNVCNYPNAVKCSNSGSPVQPTNAPPAPTEAPVVTEGTSPPKTEAPVTAAPVTEAPVTEAPVTAAPVTAAPVTAAPVTAAPVTAAPVTAAPVTEGPPASGGNYPCPADAFIYVAHPSDSNKFYLCKEGVFQDVYNCQIGLTFYTSPYPHCGR